MEALSATATQADPYGLGTGGVTQGPQLVDRLRELTFQPASK